MQISWIFLHLVSISVCASGGGHFGVGTLVPGQSSGAPCAELEALLLSASLSFWN